MPKLAYNGPPKGYNYDGTKKWTDNMNARLGHTIRLFLNCPGTVGECSPEELMEKVQNEIEKIRKEFGYTDPKTHEQ